MTKGRSRAAKSGDRPGLTCSVCDFMVSLFSPGGPLIRVAGVVSLRLPARRFNEEADGLRPADVHNIGAALVKVTTISDKEAKSRQSRALRAIFLRVFCFWIRCAATIRAGRDAAPAPDLRWPTDCAAVIRDIRRHYHAPSAPEVNAECNGEPAKR